MPSTNGLEETLHYLILALKRNESPGLINQQIRVKREINDSVKKTAFWAALISWRMTNEGFAEAGESLKSEARLFISVCQIEVNFLKNSRWSVPKYFCCAAALLNILLGLEDQFWRQKINIVGVCSSNSLATQWGTKNLIYILDFILLWLPLTILILIFLLYFSTQSLL